MEVRQRMKLTCTNSPIGLIVLIIHDHSLAHGHAVAFATTACAGAPHQRRVALRAQLADNQGYVQAAKSRPWRSRALAERRHRSGVALRERKQRSSFTFHALCRPGGYCEVAAPDPIPNSEVKRLCADGTLS